MAVLWLVRVQQRRCHLQHCGGRGRGGCAPERGLAVRPEKPHSPWLLLCSKEGLEVSGLHSPLGKGVPSAFFIAIVRPPSQAQGGHPRCRST